MKKFLILICLAALLLAGCSKQEAPAQVAATTLPVYEFTSRLCEGTGITVSRLINEQVSCLHDYSLNVRQVKAAEAAEVIVISGAGLEEFMEDLLEGKNTINASSSIPLLCGEAHDHEEQEGHHHESDPHIWLSPANAQQMARNICEGLSSQYPQQAPILEANLSVLTDELSDLQTYGDEMLADLSCRELITFHDGFHYFADAFGLTIVEAVEEESGSEASAQELIHLTKLVREHQLPAIFTERSGSVSAAGIIARETGAKSFQLDMAMAGDSYFSSMYHNIDTLKEALQ